MVKIVALGIKKIDPGKITKKVFVQNNETESVKIKIVISRIHLHGTQHCFLRINIEFMIAQDKIPGNTEIQIPTDQIRCRGRFVGEISQMQ